MIHHRSTAKVLSASFLILIAFFTSLQVKAQDGKALFQQKCASCHAIDKKLIAPALQGVEDRWNGDRTKMHAWIKNSQAYLKTGDPYATKLFEDNNKIVMTSFTDLSDDQINSILDYVKDWKPAAAAVATTGGAAASEESSDNTFLFGILTLILAVIALILLQVNSNLKKMSDEKEGIPSYEPIPFYKNKAYIALFMIVLFLVGGFYTFQGAQGLGRSKNYEPEQPIFYSHKVHAGVNQISCLYCHGGATESKHANIPSVNICMNCHMAINEYTKGPKLHRADGSEVDGTAEIKKLYQYAGWNPATQTYNGKGQAIEWTRIHNLPDHVYFNHSQHVVAGQQACQTCHGEIQKMDEVHQFADLSMGWCINCHRETKVQFDNNKFYSIYEKFHQDLKDGKMDSVTVESIGGTECQKCHY